jgi:hypothetical protein
MLKIMVQDQGIQYHGTSGWEYLQLGRQQGVVLAREDTREVHFLHFKCTLCVWQAMYFI